jgi:hypothetical protein
MRVNLPAVLAHTVGFFHAAHRWLFVGRDEIPASGSWDFIPAYKSGVGWGEA